MKRALALLVWIAAAPAPGQQAVEVGPQPAVDSYVVEPGDTLWDITARVFGDPFLWPRVWSYNPEITNPHWIYPGDMVRFHPSNERLPSQTELIADVRQMPDDVDEAMEEEVEELDEEIPEIEVIETAPVRRANAGDIRRFVGLFVTPRELREAGTLTNARDDKILFGPNDEVYLSFPAQAPRPKPGDRYMVYRTIAEVTHPVQNSHFGFMTQVTGVATIEKVEAEVTRARLRWTVIEVERGQYVAPLTSDILGRVTPKVASLRIEGVVLAVQYDSGAVAGENQVVFVDRGTNAGLQRGNRLRVYERGDPLTGRTENMPVYAIAMLTVVQATDTASTCLVTDSRREIEPGDLVITVTN
jgi:hypothetical protein